MNPNKNTDRNRQVLHLKIKNVLKRAYMLAFARVRGHFPLLPFSNISHDEYAYGSKIHGDKIDGDRVDGDKIVVRDITTDGPLAIGAGARAITIQLIQGVERLSPTYTSRIQNFLDNYLGTPKNPVPFGGRDDAVEALDTWLLDENAPPYALMTAKAGRGKSALLVQWSRRVIENQWAHLVFVPVSIRFDTASDIVTYQALAARISEIYGEPVKFADRPAGEWQEVYLSYLRRIPPDNKPVLVIIDGIDEGSGTQANPNLLPQVPAKGVRAIVSARFLTGDVDDSGWRRRLGWEQASKARSISLQPLTKQGVGDVLAKMCNPLRSLVTEVDVLNELFRLSEGDPLLVRLYVEAMLPYGEENTVALRPKELSNINRGLSGYFQQWWADQEKQWEAQGCDPLNEKQEVETFLHLCAAALSPLFQEDMERLAPELALGVRLRRAIREVGRFVIGDGKQKGFVFSHPRLAQYFWEEMGSTKQKEWEERFVTYGKGVLDALQQGVIKPNEVSLYLLQNYGTHLSRAGAPLDEMLRLSTRYWYEASVAQTKSHTSFLNDVHRVWECAAACHNLAPDSFEGQTIGYQIRCALIATSIRSLTLNISPELAAKLVEADIWSPAQALAAAQQSHEIEDRARRVAALFPYLPNDLQERTFEDVLPDVLLNGNKQQLSASKPLEYLIPYAPVSLLDSILRVVNEYNWIDRFVIVRELALRWALAGHPDHAIFVAGLQLSVSSKLETLVELLPHLSYSEREEVTNAILFLTCFVSKATKLHILTELVLHLRDEKRALVIEECLKLGKEIEYPTSLLPLLPYIGESERANIVNGVLITIKKQKQPQDQAKALKQVIPFLVFGPKDTPLELVNLFDHPQWKAEVLGTLAGRLSVLGYFEEARELIERISDPRFRTLAMLTLATALSIDQRQPILTEVVNILPQLTKEIELYKRIVELAAPYLSPEQIDSAVQATLALKYSRIHVEILTGLACYCHGEQRALVLKQALEASQAIEDEIWQVEPLVESGNQLSSEAARQKVNIRAFVAATKITRPDLRVGVLTAVAPHLEEPLRTQAFKDALSTVRNNITFADLSIRFRYLVNALPTDLLPEALQIAKLFTNSMQMHALATVASRLPESDNIRIWQHIFNIGRSYTPFIFAQVLWGETRSMPPSIVEQAIDLARKLAVAPPDAMEGSLFVRAMIALAFRCPKPKRTELIQETLFQAKTKLGDEYWAQLVAELCDYVPQMSDGQFLEQVVGVLDGLKPYHVRVHALASIAHCFSEQKRTERFLQVLELIENIENHNRAGVLRALVRNCPIDLLPNVLKLAKSLSYLKDRVEISLLAAPRLNTQERNKLIAEIFPLMSQTAHYFLEREWVWIHLVELMKQMNRVDIYALWNSSFPKLAQRERYHLLCDIRELFPIVQLLGGEKAVQDTVEAIMEVCEWWP